MNQKPLFLTITALALLIIAGVFWFIQKHQVAVDQNISAEKGVTGSVQDTTKFVTDVDPDVRNWQTKETEFFIIKFPKEWYWLGSVITNNQNFEMGKYADIGLFSGGNYHQVSENGKVESIPLQDSEVIISFSGTSTENSGTPRDSIDSAFRKAKENHSTVNCYQISDITKVSVRAYCSFIDIATHQNVQTYYIANKLHTIFFSARTMETSTVSKDILDKIAENMVVKEAW